MTIALMILAILGILIFFMGYFDKHDIIIFGGLLMLFGIIGAGISSETHIPKQQVVDLPEEYKQLSHDNRHPDTVLAFYDNDTVYIQFKPK